MAARVLDGQALARTIQEEIAPGVAAFTAQYGRPPGLGIVLVGDNPASEVYVRGKLKPEPAIGFRVDLERLPATATLAETLALVERLNRSAVHDGILVQSPLPKAMGADAEQHVFDTIAPGKDVDGLTPLNVGLLVQKRALLVACTPSGIIELLDREKIPIAGRHAVVVGRSDIVGKPIALLLLHRDATGHNLPLRARRNSPGSAGTADILVAAVGRAGLVTKAFVKPGATVIDVGMNKVTDAAIAQALFPEGHPRLALFRSKGSVLVGDVHPEVADVAGALTPVPGGVGPLTITLLMKNTLRGRSARGSANPLGTGRAVSSARGVDRRHRHRQDLRPIAPRGAWRPDARWSGRSCRERSCIYPAATDWIAAVARQGRPRVVDAAGALDRRALAAIVFADPTARRDLEAIIHPFVRARADAWFRSLDPTVHPFAIADIPLLFETAATATTRR